MTKPRIKTWWSDDEINRLELSYLHNMFDCSKREGVDVAYAYALFLSAEGLTSDNYPVFLKLMETGNHWVIDALLGEKAPESFFIEIQPNSFILSRCFLMLEEWKKGEIYPQLFLIISGIIKRAYEDAFNGYKIYPIDPADVNNLGKQLDKEQGQEYSVNKIILHILDKIASITDPVIPDDPKITVIASQANNIRGKFLDMNKKLSEAIPELLLLKGDYTKK